MGIFDNYQITKPSFGNLGEWADLIGTKLGVPETGLSEAIAGRPTSNTQNWINRASADEIRGVYGTDDPIISQIDFGGGATGGGVAAGNVGGGAGGEGQIFDSGIMVKGQEVSNITPALTANDYIYLTEGDTTASEGTYNAGQYVFKFYGKTLMVA